jgi:hypothetical protein
MRITEEEINNVVFNGINLSSITTKLIVTDIIDKTLTTVSMSSTDNSTEINNKTNY